MKRSRRGWTWFLPWIILLCAIFVCIAAFCLQNRTEVQYKAVYTLYVTPEAGRSVQPDQLARECQLLTQTEAFRNAVLSSAISDGKSRMQVKAVQDTCVLELSVAGPDAAVVSSLANAAGDELCSQLPRMFPVQEAKAMQRASVPVAADRSMDQIWLFMVASVVLLASVLLIACFTGGKATLSSACAQSDAFCLGNIHDTRRSVKRCLKAAARRKHSTLWDCADREMLEEIRQLVLRLRISPRGHLASSFLFTALKQDAQEETVAVLAASELAHQGFRVLLVEADARAAQTEDLLNVQPQNDLYDCLDRRCGLEDALTRTDIAALFYLRAYRPDRATASFAAASAFADFMNCVKTHFDFVIIHSSPADETADAAMLCLNVDSVILLARDESCTLEEIENTARQFARLRKPARGVVFTAV